MALRTADATPSVFGMALWTADASRVPACHFRRLTLGECPWYDTQAAGTGAAEGVAKSGLRPLRPRVSVVECHS